MASPTPAIKIDYLLFHVELSLAIEAETRMFKTYPMVTSPIMGNRPVNVLSTKVEQRNAIRDAMPQEVKQKP